MATGSDLDLALRLKTEGFETGKAELDALANAAGASGAAAQSAAGGVGALGDATQGVGQSAAAAGDGVGALGDAAGQAGTAAGAAASETQALGAAADQAAGSVGQAGASVGSLAEGLKGLVTGLAAAAAGITLGAVLGAVVTEAAEMERQFARTEAMVRATGESAGLTAEQLREQARALALATLQSTEGVLQAQQVMMSFRTVTGDTFTRAIELAADMSALFGGSLTGSVTQLGKALEDPVQGLSALRRVGVSFTEEQKALIQSLTETGRAAEAQTLILDVLAGQMGGVARAEAQGFAGAMDTIGQRVQEAKLAIESAFGILDRWGGLINRAAEGIRGFTEALAAGRMDAIVGLINIALDGLALAAEAVFSILGTGAQIIGNVVAVLSLVPAPILAAAAAAAILFAAWVPLVAMAATLAGAITTLVIGTISRSIVIWGAAAAAAGTLGAALKALWVVMLANPLTAFIALLGAAAAAFYVFRDSSEATAETLREQREALQAQTDEVKNLTDAMAAAKPGSDAYNDAARRLAEIVPGLSLSLSSQGTLIAELGEGYGDNARALAEWTAEQERAMAALQVQELVVTAQRWREAKEAAEAHTQSMRESYGANEATRTGIQQLTLWLANLGNRWQEDNARAIELNGTLREQAVAFRAMALAVFDTTGSVDGVRQALRDLGASEDLIALITAEFEAMETAAEAALEGLTTAQRRAAETGAAAANELAGTIGEVERVIADLDAQIETHRQDVDAALKAEAAGWKALGEGPAARMTRRLPRRIGTPTHVARHSPKAPRPRQRSPGKAPPLRARRHRQSSPHCKIISGRRSGYSTKRAGAGSKRHARPGAMLARSRSRSCKRNATRYGRSKAITAGMWTASTPRAAGIWRTSGRSRMRSASSRCPPRIASASYSAGRCRMWKPITTRASRPRRRLPRPSARSLRVISSWPKSWPSSPRTSTRATLVPCRMQPATM